MQKLLQTAVLLASISGLFLAVGYLVGGMSGVTLALILSLGIHIGSYWFSHKAVLAMHNAKQLEKLHELYARVQQLAQRAELPMPALYVYEAPEPNAFATGRNPENGIVAVSTGLLHNLTSSEIDGVIAHELAHIKNRDILIASIAATFAAAVSYLGNLLLFIPSNNSSEGQNPFVAVVTMVATPIIAAILQMSVSRTREYLADETGAQIAGSPEGLATALEKIESVFKTAPQSEENLQQAAVAHLYIANPLSGSGLTQLFSTHPPTQERVRRLRALNSNR